MPTEPAPVTVAEVVHKAVEACGEGEFDGHPPPDVAQWLQAQGLAIP